MTLSSIWRHLRRFWWLLPALGKRYHFFLLAGFSIGLVLFMSVAFVFPALSVRLKQPENKRVGIVGSYTLTNFPVQIQNQLSFGLTNLTSSGEATPAAALSWEVNEEGKSYIFHLAQNLFWQDGTPFKAGDVNYNLKDAEISTPDEFTIQIKLKEPFSPLPALLSQPLFKPGLVGLGSYKVNSLETTDGQLTALSLTPVGQNNPQPTIKYRFYPSAQKAILAYKLGEIDVIKGLTDTSLLVGWPVKVETVKNRDWHLALFYNTEDKLLSEKNVRLALTYALPDFPSEEKADSPFSPNSWAYSGQLKKYNPDLGLAKKLIAQAEEGTKSAGQKITLSTTSSYQNLAGEIAKSWENLGVQTEVKIENKVPEDFQVLLAVQEISPDPDQYSLWHSTQEKTNITRYKSPRIDKLLEDGRKFTDKEERLKKYLDFQKYLLDDAPAAFLFYPPTYNISRH
ncbi:MAG: ABC transporter substrate-binding protein [bacterium]|nr:ABC transporter substrate-binding protein [bacterium]